MSRHKDHRSKRGVSLCGKPVVGGQVTYGWLKVTCPECLKLKPVPA